MVSRRRFLLDLLWMGGALALVAELADVPSPPPPAPLPVADDHHPQTTPLTNLVEEW